MSAPLVAASLFLQYMHHHAMQMGLQPKGVDPDSLLNHHLAGAGVIVLGVLAYFEESKLVKSAWVKFVWPVLLLGIGLAVLGWSDPGTWPDGHKALAQDVEAIQHKVFALIALVIGGIELFRRIGKLTHSAWGYIFSAAIAISGVFLIFHQGEHAHIVHLQHLGMGSLVIAIGLTEAVNNTWSGTSQVRGWLRLHLASLLTIALGLMLVFYVE